jgi:hypothetical protein
MTDDVRKLLGGYATGTLTDEEKQTLFNAAVDDADLFNALADEHALKELLDDPTIRAQALRAAETPVFSIRASLRDWFERPRSKALVATAAVLVVAIAVTTYRDQQKLRVTQIERPSPALLAPMVPVPESTAPREAKPRPPRPETAAKREGNVSADVAASAQPEVKALMKEQRAEPAVAPVPSPPAAPAAVATSFRDEQLAAIAAPGVKYMLMKRSAAGEFDPVPLDTPLAADEEARLRVDVSEAGTVALARDDSKSVTSTFVQPAQPATFTLPSGTRSATLSFTPASARLVGNTLIPALRSQARAKQTPAAAATEADMQKQAEAPAPVQIQIKLNRK